MSERKTRLARISGYIIAIYQMVGGLIGVWVVYTEATTNISLESILIQYGFFTFSIIAGIVLLVKRKSFLTYVNLFLQFIQFKVGGFALYFLQGVYLGVGIIPSKMEYFTDISLSIFVVLFRFNYESGKDVIGFNLFILMLLFLLNRYEKVEGIRLT